jgi:hypothetical protein
MPSKIRSRIEKKYLRRFSSSFNFRFIGLIRVNSVREISELSQFQNKCPLAKTTQQTACCITSRLNDWNADIFRNRRKNLYNLCAHYVFDSNVLPSTVFAPELFKAKNVPLTKNILKSTVKLNSAVLSQFYPKKCLCGHVKRHESVIFATFTESFPLNQFSPNFFLRLNMSF